MKIDTFGYKGEISNGIFTFTRKFDNYVKTFPCDKCRVVYNKDVRPDRYSATILENLIVYSGDEVMFEIRRAHLVEDIENFEKEKIQYFKENPEVSNWYSFLSRNYYFIPLKDEHAY